MGYHVEQISSVFYIKKENQQRVRDALLKYLEEEDAMFSHSSLKNESLQELFNYLGWICKFDKGTSNIVGLTIGIDYLKGDEEDWMDEIAPYVEKGSHIDMIGEDLYTWSWWFDGKGVFRYTGMIVYPGRPDFFFDGLLDWEEDGKTDK